MPYSSHAPIDAYAGENLSRLQHEKQRACQFFKALFLLVFTNFGRAEMTICHRFRVHKFIALHPFNAAQMGMSLLVKNLCAYASIWTIGDQKSHPGTVKIGEKVLRCVLFAGASGRQQRIPVSGIDQKQRFTW